MMTATMDASALVREFWQLANAQQWSAMGRLLHPAFLYEVPQTREYIEGVEGFVDFFATWPGPWTVRLERVIAQEGQVAVQMQFEGADGAAQDCVGFYEIRDAQIARIVEYWPEAYEPPARHSAHVRRRVPF